MIDIVCRAKAHETKVAKIASFFPLEPVQEAVRAAAIAADPEWSSTSYYDVVEGEPDRWDLDMVVSRTARQQPSDRSVLIPRGAADQRRRPDGRWSIECRLCGLKVSVRESTVAPILSQARDSGVSEIPLELLASMLRK